MFLVLALPRSRTFWLSKLLSYGDYECGHEETRHLRSADDARRWISQDCYGSAETAIAPFWRLINSVNPNVKIVVVRRPVEDAIASFMDLNFRGICKINENDLRRTMRHLDVKLQQIAARCPNALSVNFDDLDDIEVIKSVWSHCLPYPFDEAWWERLRSVNIQCNMRAIARYCILNRDVMDKMATTAVALSRSQLSAKPPISADGVTFQQESFDDWVRDGVPLFEQHCIEIGEDPNSWRKKNLPLIKHMYDTGFVQFTTARLNGRMFGYLGAVINPSLDTCDEFFGVHTTFYVSKDMPGIGLKLQRASVAALKEKGASKVVFYEGVRADGPRLGTLYRRLGAENIGKLHSLEFL